MEKLSKFFKIFIFSFLFIGFFSSFIPAYAQEVWVKDQEVTFVGKTAARANGFLEWALSRENYKWITITSASDDPIVKFWVVVRNIVFAVLLLFILGSALVMIVTRGQNITIMRFIPRFLIIFVLIIFSFALIRFLYQATDVLQGFFLNVDDPNGGPDRNIGPQDLLYVEFDYADFIGYRLIGIENDESSFISLLLVKLTAITYYAMTGLLVIRKVILWFFIILSPVFPVLLFFRPIRNTAKIWIGEFFRWLLYAPLFALFLNGLVKMWRSVDSIPLDFTTPAAAGSFYPTAINILLGGPGQPVSITNSVNLPTTFALYVAALIMLWVVVLLPFLLLQIFLDYMNNVSVSENPLLKNIAKQSWFSKVYGGNPKTPPPIKPTPSPAPYGLSRTLPSFNKRQMEDVPTRIERATVANVASTQGSGVQRFSETRDMLRLTNLTIPKMRDIARFETSLLSNNLVNKQEANSYSKTLERIATPTIASLPSERERFTTIKERLVTQLQKGDSLAASILNASKITSGTSGSQAVNVTTQLTSILKGIANPQVLATTTDREKITEIHEKLVSEKEKGSTFASAVLATTEKISSTTITEKEKETLVKDLQETLISEKAKGNVLAGEILRASTVSIDQKTDISSQLTKMLVGIANPELVTPPTYLTKIKELKETLIHEKEKGDPLASSILIASQKVADPAIPQSQKQIIVDQLKEKLVQERERGNLLASSILPGATTVNSQLALVLQQIARPEIIETKNTIERISSLREKLIAEKAKGNLLATTVLQASEKVSSATVSDKEKEVIVEKLKETLVSEKQRGNALAAEILPEEKTIIQTSGVTLPAENKVQQVSIEEYEDVKRMWQENYQNMDVPVGSNGKAQDKHEFIQNDIDNITETINLLSSDDKTNVEKGMNRVANILPFLLLGGFSKSEVVSYLKAKLEAARAVINGVVGKKEEDETLINRDVAKAGEAQKTMQAEIPSEEHLVPTPLNAVGVSGNIEDKDKHGKDGSRDGSPPSA